MSSAACERDKTFRASARGRWATIRAKHHVDHVWLYSRGGSNTVDNLRGLFSRTENLRKIAERPRRRGMW
jgi:hypothetical protein